MILQTLLDAVHQTWSQDVDVASASPLTGKNVAYVLHYYAATHKQSYRTKATTALNRGCALFVTEFGTCESSGGGTLDSAESITWWNYLYNNKISWCNWALDDKTETSAALKPGASEFGGWDTSEISTSGQMVRDVLLGVIVIPTLKPSEIEMAKYSGFISFPNPVNDYLNIKITDAGKNNTTIYIYDNMGRRVLQKITYEKNIVVRLQNWSNGIYHIKIISNNKVYNQSILKR